MEFLSSVWQSVKTAGTGAARWIGSTCSNIVSAVASAFRSVTNTASSAWTSLSQAPLVVKIGVAVVAVAAIAVVGFFAVGALGLVGLAALTGTEVFTACAWVLGAWAAYVVVNMVRAFGIRGFFASLVLMPFMMLAAVLSSFNDSFAIVFTLVTLALIAAGIWGWVQLAVFHAVRATLVLVFTTLGM